MEQAKPLNFGVSFQNDHGEVFPPVSPVYQPPGWAKWKEYLPPGTFPQPAPVPEGYPVTNTWYRIYTNIPGANLEFKTNWVLATAAQTDSNGLGSINFTNWGLPTNMGFFLFERTNTPNYDP